MTSTLIQFQKSKQRLLNSFFNSIEHQWQAREYLRLLSFCADICEYSHEDLIREYESNKANSNSFSDFIENGIAETKIHLTSAHLMLLRKPAYHLLNYKEPRFITDLFNHLYSDTSDEVIEAIMGIMAKPRQVKSNRLNELQQLVVLYAKSICLYELYCHHKKLSKIDSQYLSAMYKENWSFQKEFATVISENMDKYSTEKKENTLLTKLIDFKDDREFIKVNLFLKYLFSEILSSCIFKTKEMETSFMNCIQDYELPTGYIFEFNDSYQKKLIVQLFEIIKSAFKRNDSKGALNFIKRSNQFMYKGVMIRTDNWHTR